MTAPDLTPEERAEVIRFGVHEPEIFDAMESDLEGATTPGDPAAWAKDPGEFAARYNSWTPERRHAWAERIVQDSMTAARCHQADHDGEIDRLRTALLDVTAPHIPAVNHTIGEDGVEAPSRPEGVNPDSQRVTEAHSEPTFHAGDEVIVCRECLETKHASCSGVAVSVDAEDDLIEIPCQCAADNHEEDHA